MNRNKQTESVEKIVVVKKNDVFIEESLHEYKQEQRFIEVEKDIKSKKLFENDITKLNLIW